MEDPYIEHEVVYETDSLEEAENKAEELKIKRNSKADVESTWCNNTYHVNVNTLSDGGEKLRKEFSKDFDERLSKIIEKDNYSFHKVGGLVFFINDSLIRR